MNFIGAGKARIMMVQEGPVVSEDLGGKRQISVYVPICVRHSGLHCMGSIWVLMVCFLL